LEYSVVYTDRAPNHNMSQRFQGVMRGTSGILKTTHHAHSAIVVPGSGSFGMEAVARQFAAGQDAGCCVMVGSARRKTKPGWPPGEALQRRARPFGEQPFGNVAMGAQRGVERLAKASSLGQTCVQ
jgi:hypothetical protein